MNPIDALFQELRAKKQKAFIPFITAGDPNLTVTAALTKELVRRGVSLIEIGFPYSDPIADGSVIQASYTRALHKGLRVDDICAAFRKLVLPRSVALVAMVSYSLIHHRGPELFIARAREAGFAGAIVPDLPLEEAQELAKLCARDDFKLVQLVTPTTPRERAQRIAQLATGFLYCVSVVGITGERAQIPPQLVEQLRWLKTQTDLPLCVGFGISRPEHVRLLRDAADGVIVGSALVRNLGLVGAKSENEVIQEIGAQVTSLMDALNEPGLTVPCTAQAGPGE
jgi:tryptophan synthase alpha chain